MRSLIKVMPSKTL